MKAPMPLPLDPAHGNASRARDPLIPIRLDLTVDMNRRIQETFTWPLNEPSMKPHDFATQLANDLILSETARDEISRALSEQIAAFKQPPSPPPSTQECRHIIRLDLRIGRVVIRDQFEWDLSMAENSPEGFAEGLCRDLGLGTEHVVAVGHAVRGQLRELGEVWERKARCKVLKAERVVRGEGEIGGWEPMVECLTAEETERLERKERREARLMRRNRGKGDARGNGGRGRGSRRGSAGGRRSSVG